MLTRSPRGWLRRSGRLHLVPVNLPSNFYGRDASVPSLTLVGRFSGRPLLHDYTTSEGRFSRRVTATAVIRRSLADQLGLHWTRCACRRRREWSAEIVACVPAWRWLAAKR